MGLYFVEEGVVNKIKTVLSIGVVAFVSAAWGIDEHRPIQGGTTNPTPTGPTDHTRIQNRPEPTVDNSNITLDPAVETNIHVRTTQPKKNDATPSVSANAGSGVSAATSVTNSSGSTGDGGNLGTTSPAPKAKK
jgi:cytoskeletal protein RodZ